MTTPPNSPIVRSALFVPASSERFLRSAERCGADAVILDLEDSVVDSSRSTARRFAGEFVERAQPGGCSVFVRINPLSAGLLAEDLDAVVRPSLAAVLLPKLRSAAEVRELDRELSWYEGRGGLTHGSVRIWPLIETPSAISAVDEIARASTRVAFLGGAVAQGGDLVTSLGLDEQADGLESLYLRSRVLVAARTAGVHNPMTGLFTDIGDLEGLERAAQRGRQLGYEGMMVIHPSHVPVVNRVFSPSADEVAEARRVLVALADADRNGTGAARLGGRMIDVAMARWAQLVIERDTLVRDRSEQHPADGS